MDKWYIDAIFEDGTVLLVYLARASVLAWPMARVMTDLFRPDGTRIHGDAVAREVSGDLDDLRFGPATIRGDRLKFATKRLSGDLRYQPRHGPIALRDPFLQLGARMLSWNVEIPDADVEGTLRVDGQAVQVRGRGYRDRVAFDLLPWSFPIRALSWGRAVAGEHAATWVRASTPGDTVEAAWKDGQQLSSAAGVVLGESRTLLDADVLALEGARLGVLRRVLERTGMNPHEVKRCGPCTIDGATGIAVHETVTWP